MTATSASRAASAPTAVPVDGAAVPLDDVELPLLDVGSAEYEQDPYAVIERLRKRSWLARTPRGHTVLDYAAARDLKRSADFVRIFDAVTAEESGYLYRKAIESISSENGPRLILLRRLMVQALRPRNIAHLEPAFAEIAASLLAELPDGEVDLVRDFCDRYPGLVMGPILGVPFADTRELDAWATTVNELGNHSRYGSRVTAIEAAWRSLEDYLTELIELRRAEPVEDIVSDLVRGADADESITEDDLLIVTVALVSAAVDNLRGQLALTVEALLAHPAVWERVRRDPEAVPQAVEEGLRYAAQGDDIQHRVARETELRGIRFPEGALVAIHKKAVNRDPGFADDPHRFSLDRSGNQHLTFGVGLHACVGATLARAAMNAAVAALAARVGEWEPAGPVGRRTPMASGGHAVSLPVRLTAAAGAAGAGGPHAPEAAPAEERRP